MKFDNILQRLDYYAKTVGLNDNKITKEAGLSVGLLGNSRKNKGGLNSESIEKLLYKYRNLSADWLLTGRGNMLNEVEKPPGVVMEGIMKYETICEKCAVKDELIEGLRQQIDTQKELISLLKEMKDRKENKSPEEDGQKRKAAS